MKTKIPTYTIGLDLGDKKHAICVLNKAGEIIDERSITIQERTLQRQVVARQPAISFSISFQHPYNRAGGRTSNVA